MGWLMDQAYWPALILLVLTAMSLAYKPVMMLIVAPIRIRRENRISATARYGPIDLQTLSPEAQQQLDPIVQQFRAEGFEPLGPPLSHLDSDSTSVVSTLTNASGDIAEVVFTSAGIIRTFLFYVQSRFADAKVVGTGSYGHSVFPQNPHTDGIAFEWVRDAHALCEAHRRRLAKLGLKDQARSAPPSDAVRYNEEQWVTETQRWAACGYIHHDSAAGDYHYTWKGAFALAWKTWPPVRNWRQNRRECHTRRVWHELGMDQWQQSIGTAHTVEVQAQPPAVAMAYQPQLREGEVHMHSEDGALTVRIGTQSRWGYLRSNWFLVALTGFFGLYAVGISYLRRLWGIPLLTGLKVYDFFVLLGLIWNAASIATDLIKHRGAVVLVASARGLSYRNTPQLRPHGQIARGEIELLAVGLVRGFIRHKHRLVLFPTFGRMQVLAVKRQKETLEKIKEALIEAMGMKPPAEVAVAT
jgi:hypothetical protein